MPEIREFTLEQLETHIRSEEHLPMAKTSTPVKPKTTVATTKKKTPKSDSPVSEADVKNSKVVAKAAKPTEKKAEKAAPKAKTASTEAYSPRPNTQRFYIHQALITKGGTVKKVKERALALAQKAGHKDWNEESFKSFDVPYYANLLSEKGLKVSNAEGKYIVTV